jgi:hypothetical protein
VEDLTRLAYQQSADTAEESTRCLLAAFAYLGIPESMIDLGCGDGHLVQVAGSVDRLTPRGWGRCVAYGVDANADSLRGGGTYDQWHVERGDLSKPLNLDTLFKYADPKRHVFDMALCWEVAEHLPPATGPTLCDTAVSVLKPGGWLLWTAAVPGQGGSGHLAEFPHSHWKFLLTERGLLYQPGITNTLRRVWAEVAPKAFWYGQNLLVFKKPEAA